MAKIGKKYGATSDFATANPPLMLAPSNPDHFDNIHKLPRRVMDVTREGCKLPSGLTNGRKLIQSHLSHGLDQ